VLLLQNCELCLDRIDLVLRFFVHGRPTLATAAPVHGRKPALLASILRDV
jgi:hypothetical protein